MNLIKKGWLFDLDGTLLPLRVDEFIPRYVESLCRYVAKVAEPHRFQKCLLAATASMIEDEEPDQTNEEVFWRHFGACLGTAATARVIPLVKEYYQYAYPQLGEDYEANPSARRVLETVLARGGRLILATNPVFPQEAIEERMRWADIHGLPFELVTSYENMHSCKPRVEYYREILERLELEARECIMVGNDIQEDVIPAHSLGMDTYLVNEMVINRSPEKMTVASPSGSLQELIPFWKGGKV